ncbi:MAG: RloB family protein [Planctomycetaceae bacterium]|nr:RloB family protein [Planctomycetaceae bacterium]
MVIASEDTHAVQLYFDRFQPRRVQFRVLPTENGKSSPEAIMQRLKDFEREYEIGEGDQLWYCGDLDHWAESNHIAALRSVLRSCAQAGYEVAISNPCFELWLLLHFCDAPQEIENCKSITQELSRIAGGYSKPLGCRTEISVVMIEAAMTRAAALDQNTHEIPATPTTRVYRIMQVLISRESIRLRPVG